MKAAALVAPPHDVGMAAMFFGGLLGDGFDVAAYNHQDDVADPDGLSVVITALSPVGASLIERAPALGLIQVPGHGYEHVDVAAATAAGVPVATVSGSGAEAHTVAEWAILAAGTLSRRVLDGHAALRRGESKQIELLQGGVFEMAGKTFGIVGLGHIGREVAVRARAFGMTVLYHDVVRAPDEAALGISFRALDDLLREADFVSLHVPDLPGTRGMIGGDQLGLMKQTAILINSARGSVVEHDALVQALREGRIRGACLDVFDPEPPPADDPLLGLDNVLLSPHMAGVTAESVMRILAAAAGNVARWARGEAPRWVVNPEVLR